MGWSGGNAPGLWLLSLLCKCGRPCCVYAHSAAAQSCAPPLQITVDGDTSTNDTVLALASGAAGNAHITDAASPAGAKLEAALTGTLQGLAKSVAWDGEGATCLLEIRCTGAAAALAATLFCVCAAAPRPWGQGAWRRIRTTCAAAQF